MPSGSIFEMARAGVIVTRSGPSVRLVKDEVEE